MRKSLSIVAIANLALAGCMTPPASLDLSLNKPSEAQKYVVAIQPQSPVITLNRLHTWEVKVSAVDGAPVLHAHIAVDGGMPQHGHGLPTRPRVTQELGEGRYLLEGMKFSMTGWWVIKLRVETEQYGADAVTFNKVIELPRREKI
jgi:YtkA-like